MTVTAKEDDDARPFPPAATTFQINHVVAFGGYDGVTADDIAVAVTRMQDPATGRMVRAGNQKIVAATFRHDTSRRPLQGRRCGLPPS